MTTQPQVLGDLSWPEVGERARSAPPPVGLTLVVPVGSCEQHGPHLPFDVDTAVAEEVSARFAAGRGDIVLGPPLAYGASGEHEGFPGTLSVGHEVLCGMLLEIGRSSSLWASRVLFVSGHGGNVWALSCATRRLHREGRDAAWWPCHLPGTDAHAGRAETSMMLALRASSVRMDRAEPGDCRPIEALMPELRSHKLVGVTPNGVLGDPLGASGAEGRHLLDELADRLRDEFSRWAVEDGLLGSGLPSWAMLE